MEGQICHIHDKHTALPMTGPHPASASRDGAYRLMEHVHGTDVNLSLSCTMLVQLPAVLPSAIRMIAMHAACYYLQNMQTKAH